MSWRESNAMSEKIKFVLSSQEPGSNITELCREYGVARSTGMKWLKRFRESGLKGLEEESRRPNSSPLATSAELVCEIVKLSEGPRKHRASRIQKKLKRKYPPEKVPSRSTIQRVLEKIGRVDKRRVCRNRSNSNDGVARATSCNEVWTADFKGWWRTGDKKRCEPLTIMDLSSRFLLELKALPNVQTERTKDRFRSCFERYGLPEVIWTDNGAPFAAAAGLLGLSQLSVWWIKLGITPKRIPKGEPWCNGVHERMHGDIAREIEVDPAWDLCSQQRIFDTWRDELNDTPHGSLDDKTPAEVYRRSRRLYDPSEPEFRYLPGIETRNVASNGCLDFKGTKYYLSKAFSGEVVGFEQIDESKYRILFCETLIGTTILSNSPLRGNSVKSFQHFHWLTKES